MDYDIFDNGTPKYQSPQDIYDGLCTIETGEEVGILGEMFADVSWENQDYYYTEKGGRLREKWDELTYYDGDWKMELAVWQVDGGETHDIVYLCLENEDAAKALGFKKIFIDELLSGSKNQYEQAIDEYKSRIDNIRFWRYQSFMAEWRATWKTLNPQDDMMKNPYDDFSGKLYKKATGFKLEEERKLIIEARALLNAYDDFMYGLKSNQHLYKYQEQAYKNKLALLQEQYDNAVKILLQSAHEQGLVLKLPDKPLLLENA